MTEHVEERKNALIKVDRKSATKLLKDLFRTMELSAGIFDPCFVTFDLLIPYGYLCFKPGVDCAYSYDTESLNPEKEVPVLSPSEHMRLLAFLEACAQLRAVTYRRDGTGFVWCICGEVAYRTCCERFGYTDADFEVHHRPESKA